MASRTYSEEAIVLKKTKLKESDLILTLLARDGRQIRAVAKGARKPTSSFASRLELFSRAQLLLVSGRSMDIVKEAKLVSSHDGVRCDMLPAALGSCVAELLVKTTAVGLENPRVFAMFDSFLDHLGAPGLDEDASWLLGAACLMKLIAQLGFRPCLDCCVECGTPRDVMLEGAPNGKLPFSYQEGGILCSGCAASKDAYPLQANTVRWLESLILQRFDELASLSVDSVTRDELFDFCGSWTNVQLGIRLKSLEYLRQL